MRNYPHQRVMISVLASYAVVRGLETWSYQTRDYKIGICCISDKYELVRE
jgi:hypothetical protein